ncbi:hypothetical protein FRB94_012978 [Tulasnella sp. JGI-2019a]|nr:hypothetical protein FRB94_012978 [Tulasnella sp. JGI-2019a]
MGETSNELPQSTPLVEWISFSGSPSEDVLVFAQGVLRIALAYGRQRDLAWMADFAYGCLSGQALEWFEYLDAGVKQDWSKLRPIMMEKFLPIRTAFHLRSRARIRVVRGSGVVLGYLSPPVRDTYPKVVAKADEALVLIVPTECAARQVANNIKTVTRNDEVSAYPFIGLETYGSFWIIKACEEGPEGSVFKGRTRADTTRSELMAASKVWLVKKLDGTTEELYSEWIEDSGGMCPLQFLLFSSTASVEWGGPSERPNHTTSRNIFSHTSAHFTLDAPNYTQFRGIGEIHP